MIIGYGRYDIAWRPETSKGWRHVGAISSAEGWAGWWGSLTVWRWNASLWVKPFIQL